MSIDSNDKQALYYTCVTCGYNKKDETGGLIMETMVQEKASDSYKVYLNEFTINDHTLPHMKTIPCPNTDCAGKKGGKETDVVYIKYDAAGLKYLYVCTHCESHWRSR